MIGSGIAGLTAGAALARAGHRVLILEQRDTPGGAARTFTRHGYRFSPGFQPLVDLHRGGELRRILEGLDLGADLAFCELAPEGVEHLFIGGERFDRPRGLDRWMSSLQDRFPREREGIAACFAVLARIHDERERCARLSGAELLKVPLLAPALCRWGLLPLSALVDRCVRDPLLRAVLAAQRADLWPPPARAPLSRCASAVARSAPGAYYPRGGPHRLVQAFLRATRRRGGEIRTGARAVRVLLERGRAAGVETALGERIKAGRVVTGPDLAGRAGRQASAARAGALRAVHLLCAVDLDLRAMGFDSGTYHWLRDPGAVRGEARASRAPRGGPAIDRFSLSITTLQDPGRREDGLHTLEILAALPDAQLTGRDSDPAALLLCAAEQLIPGLRRAARFADVEVGAPLPDSSGSGGLLGAAHDAMGALLDGVPIPSAGPAAARLYCYGQPSPSHDLAAAARAGLAAAQRALGLERPEDCLGPPDGSIRVYPADRPDEWLPALEARRRAA